MRPTSPFVPTCLLACASLGGFAHAQPELEPPREILAGGEPIDCEEGYAAPFVHDFDGDGLDDLLVGQFGYGRVRVYRNVGSANEPRYDDFEWLRAGGTLARVPTGCCVGFGPQVVDLDGDGRRDVITGCWPKALFVFRGNGNGRFETPLPILGQGGKPLEPGSASTAFAADWDGDGDLDLISGNLEGEVVLFRNARDGHANRFTKGQRVAAGGRAIEVPGGDSGPILADWDDDGRDDLLVAAGDGSVLCYHNRGTAEKPEFISGAEIVPAGFRAGDVKAGYRVKIAVADWNHDGGLDLLVGDRQQGDHVTPSLSPAERAAAEAAQEEHAELEVKWQELLLAVPSDASEVEVRAVRLRELVEAMAKLEEVIEPARKRLEPDSRVFVFLRASSPAAPERR